MSAFRDAQTGELLGKLAITVNQPGALPLFIKCQNWAGVAAYLRSADFRRIQDRVTSISVTNREVL